MRKIYLIALICLTLNSCDNKNEFIDNKLEQQQELSQEEYFNKFNEALENTFNAFYENVTIDDTYLTIDAKIDKSCKEFAVIDGYDMNGNFYIIPKTRSTQDNTVDNGQYIINRILEILKTKDYKEVRNQIFGLYKEIDSIANGDESDNLKVYVKQTERLLDFYEKNANRLDVINFLWKYNDPELKQTLTRSQPPVEVGNVPDGLYGDPNNPRRYFMALHGIAYIYECPQGLVFHDNCKCCNYPPASKSDFGWGKCIAYIISQAGLGALGGVGAGSVIPGIGTVAGGVAGGIFGGIAGYITGC